MEEKLKLGVLVSGVGTNLKAILESCAKLELNAEVKIVISNIADALALLKAKEFNVATAVYEHLEYPTRQAHEKVIIDELKKNEVELVCLAGYKRIMGADFLAAFSNRIINMHPALLPSFPGLDAQRQAWEYGAKITGCTVHFVDEKLDHGPIILQAAVNVKEDDTAETLRERILKEEHRLYIQAIKLYSERRLFVEGRRVRIKP